MGTDSRRIRVTAIAVAIAALAVAAGIAVAGAPAVAGGPALAGPGGDPPTRAEIAAATREFLDQHATDAAAPAPRPRASVSAASGARPAAALLPQSRVVAYYGAPQLTRTVIGRYAPAEAGRRLIEQASAYEGPARRPVTASIDLIGVIATAGAGSDGKYRMRQSPAVIDTYLNRARRIGARLMLDIQPGRAKLLAELKALRRWVIEPDVDVAIDPEWNVGPRGVPGRTEGSVRARQLNRFSRRMQRMVKRRGLPPKILAVHQFHDRSVRKRGRVRQRRHVAVTLNFDGIGSPGPKQAGYARLAAKRLHKGFSLFYSLDSPLMSPRDVLALQPEPDFLLYQ